MIARGSYLRFWSANSQRAKRGHPHGVIDILIGFFVASGPRARQLRVIAVVSVLVPVIYVLSYAVDGYHQSDIAVYLMGASHLTRADLYSLKLLNGGLQFTYPPFAALAFVPLLVVPFDVAEGIWGIVNVAGLVIIIYRTIRFIAPEVGRTEAKWSAALLTTPACALPPVLSTLSYGQVNLVLGALIVCDLTTTWTLRGRTVPRGALIGIAAAIKLTPLILVPYLLFTRQLKAAFVAMGTFVVAGALALAVTPRASIAWWSHDIFETSRVGNVLFFTNQNLRVALERFDHANLAGPGLALLTGLVAIFGLALAVQAYRHSGQLLGTLVAVVTGLIVSPVTWSHHLIWVVPVVIWFAAAKDRPRWGVVVAACTCTVFWAAPIYFVPQADDQQLHLRGLGVVAGNSFFLAMCLFLLGILVVIRRSPTTSVTQPPARTDRDRMAPEGHKTAVRDQIVT